MSNNIIYFCAFKDREKNSESDEIFLYENIHVLLRRMDITIFRHSVLPVDCFDIFPGQSCKGQILRQCMEWLKSFYCQSSEIVMVNT